MQPLRRTVEMQFFGDSNELTKQTNLDHRADVTTIVRDLHVPHSHPCCRPAQGKRRKSLKFEGSGATFYNLSVAKIAA